MSFIPNPKPLAAALRDEAAVDAQRNLYCPLYDACLHLAVKRRWEGWTCRACAGRDLHRDGPEREDYARAQPAQDIL